MKGVFSFGAIRVVLPLGVWLLLANAAPGAVSEAIKEKAGEALSAAEAGDHVKAYGIWASLLELEEAKLNRDAFMLIRSMVYREALKNARAAGEDCSAVLPWVEKGTRPGPPDYSMGADVDYPSLLLLGGVCSHNQNQYEDAYTRLTVARSEFQKFQDLDTREILAEASRIIKLIEGNVVLAGDYVTNPGVVQQWIGRVQRRDGDKLQIQLTYVNRDLAPDKTKGEPMELLVAECKELSAISADAALKGWK